MDACDLCGATGRVTESVARMWTGATSTVRIDARASDELRVLTIPSEPPTVPRRPGSDPAAVVARADRARRVWLLAFALLVAGLLTLLVQALGLGYTPRP